MLIDKLLGLVQKHQKWRGRQCLNLIPSENVMSPAARALLSSELAHRYTARDHFYMGTNFIDEIEQYGEEVARNLFKAQTADLRSLSGHVADLTFLAAFTNPQDVIMCVSPENGGYPGLWKNGLARLLNLKTLPFPFSKENLNIKIEEAEQVLERTKPKVVIFGASLIAFPHPVKELARAARQSGAHVGFDGSHVLGLIAGDRFQDPLNEGACTLYGSTHKSFFGPQGGIILADRDCGEAMKAIIYPGIVDNAHWNRIAALTMALCEMKEFGKAYASQVIRNSQTLAKALFDYGFPVACQHLGFTQSHQVVLDYGGFGMGRDTAEKLQQANIIADCGVRLGTCEVTRRGMKEAEMLRIAELIKRTAIDGERPKSVKRDVSKISREFLKVEYCFS